MLMKSFMYVIKQYIKYVMYTYCVYKYSTGVVAGTVNIRISIFLISVGNMENITNYCVSNYALTHVQSLIRIYIVFKILFFIRQKKNRELELRLVLETRL